jgi:hypothetical protein
VFESGLILFLLVPGLLVYCALYGIFHSGRTIAPEPPAANSIEAVTVILIASLAVHGITAVAISMNEAMCCLIETSFSPPDLYDTATRALANDDIRSETLTTLLIAALVQGVVAYAAARFWLIRLARKNRLPPWIYGWATNIANSADDDDTLIIAYVLTTAEHGGQAVVYGGALLDIALKPDGCVSRITLWDAERYLVDLDSDTASRPLSRFPLMIIDAENIRNIAFDTITLDAA